MNINIDNYVFINEMRISIKFFMHSLKKVNIVCTHSFYKVNRGHSSVT